LSVHHEQGHWTALQAASSSRRRGEHQRRVGLLDHLRTGNRCHAPPAPNRWSRWPARAAWHSKPTASRNNVQRYGNTTAASIPIALREALDEGRLARGEPLLLTAFGGGLTWASSAVRW
jgi:3-hydroxy-3-methylglutaryl CoA synthase